MMNEYCLHCQYRGWCNISPGECGGGMYPQIMREKTVKREKKHFADLGWEKKKKVETEDKKEVDARRGET